MKHKVTTFKSFHHRWELHTTDTTTYMRVFTNFVNLTRRDIRWWVNYYIGHIKGYYDITKEQEITLRKAMFSHYKQYSVAI